MKKRLALKKLTIRDLDESSLDNVVGGASGHNTCPNQTCTCQSCNNTCPFTCQGTCAGTCGRGCSASCGTSCAPSCGFSCFTCAQGTCC